MTPEYLAFLAGKAPKAMASGIEPSPMPGHMFDFQAAATAFCLRQGRAALFLDTGLGKTICELEFARQAAAAANGWSLILTPLAVARQIEAEGWRFGYKCRVIHDQSEACGGINICNYDRLDKLDPSAFGCVVLDESSILKSFAGKTTMALIASFSDTPFRLCATATPAPNDHMEIGTHSEFLGIMPQGDMLVRWFINNTNDTGTWRIKGHAADHFWNWCASWAVMASSPEDLGFDGSRFVLPELVIHRHKAIGEVKPIDGMLFANDVSATTMHAVKRQTADARADVVATLISASDDPSWLVWVDTDYEFDAVHSRLGNAIEVRGSHSPEVKEDRLLEFLDGQKTLITKPKIAGQGMNFQHCAQAIFVGRSFSYEQWYQCVRRNWRFGQTRQVHVHLIVAEGEDQIGRVLERKAEAHASMKQNMLKASRRAMSQQSALKVAYQPTYHGRLPEWLKSCA